MALFQIRRGNNSSKGTLSYGEPYFNSDLQSVQFGASGSNEEVILVKLNTGASSDAKWSGSLANSGSLSLTGDITASNAYFRGDVYISGSIQLGDNAVQDHITVIADFNSDLVPSQNTQYNLGSGGKYWKQLYASTASVDVITAVGNVTAFSSSLNTRINSINSTTASLNSYTASTDAKIAAIHTATASLNSFTSSIDTTIKTKINTEGVISGSSQVLFTSINGYPTYTSSVAALVNSTSASLSSSVAAYNSVQDGRINSTTSSLNSFATASNTFSASVSAATSSIIGRLNSLETTSGSLVTFSSSVAVGIEFTSSNVTIKGNLLVKGTTTSVNSTTVDIGDNIISLNGTGASNGGIIVRDASGTTTSGSLLWDTTNDYWKAGPNGAEQRLIRETEYNSYTSSNDSRVSSLETESGSVRTTLNTYSSSINSYTSSNNGNISAIHTSTSSLNSFTSSINTTIKNKLNSDGVVSGSSQITITSTTGYTTYTGSVATMFDNDRSRLSNLENVSGTFFAYTASNDSVNGTQNFKLGALETTSASLNTFTSSANGRISSLETESGSIRSAFNTHTSSYLVASSSFNTRVGALENFSSSLNASYVSETEFGVWSGSIHSFTASVNSTTSSQNSRLGSLQIATASLFLSASSLFASASSITSSFSQVSQSLNYKLNNIIAGTGFLDVQIYEEFTSSINPFTASINLYTQSLNAKTGSFVTTSSFNSFTSSQSTQNTAVNTTTASLNSYTASNNTNISAIHTATASLNSYTASNTTNINAIHTFTASVNLNNAALNTASASLNTYSSSLKAAIETTGSNVTIIGNLLVKGTTTQVDSTTINIADNIIQLNGAGSANGGLIVRDATGGTTVSGSLLWDTTNDYWKAGANGAEQRIVLNNEFTSYSASINSYTSSNNTNISAIHTATASLNGKTGSYATTGSNTYNGDQRITGSLYILNDLVVYGSSSMTYITSSQLNVDISFISVNVNEPSERFGGLKVYDSGSSNATASLAWDSLNNRWIYQNASGSSYGGAILIAGPRNSGSLGNETTLTSGRIPKSVGGDHIDDSVMSESNGNIGISGSLVVTGSILASGTSLVSGSSQIDAIATTNWSSGIKTQLNNNNVVSGSSQITTLLPSGVVSGSSQIDATATTNWSTGIKTQLNNNTVVSGSSQITLASTTGFGTYINQPLLTTSAVTFAGVLSNGNLGVTGSIAATADIVAYASSDKRYKNNIVLISDAISKVSKLNGVTWEWNDEVDDVTKQSPKTGLIAQEVKEVLPEVVNERENGFLGLDYSKMVGLLVEAIKEQQTTIEDLKARINKLEGGE